MFRVSTPIIRSSYNCNYSFWYWLTGSTTMRSRCWVGTDLCVSYGRYSFPTQMNTYHRAAYRNTINWIQSHFLDNYYIWFTMHGPMNIKKKPPTKTLRTNVSPLRAPRYHTHLGRLCSLRFFLDLLRRLNPAQPQTRRIFRWHKNYYAPFSPNTQSTRNK